MRSSSHLAVLALALTTACSKPNEAAPVGGSDPKKPAMKTAPQSTPPTTDLVMMRDPVENAFTMGMPKGWHNRTYSARVFDIHSIVVNTVSPDGSVLIFSGDPSLPQYWSPAAATPIHYDMARVHPRMKIEPFVPATEYFPAYVKRKFGKLSDFKLVSTEVDAEGEQKLQKRFAEAGHRVHATAVQVAFSYTDGGRPMNALLMGTTTDSGPFWIVTVTGITTSGDPKQYIPMIEAMGRSYQANPAWQAEQNQKHQARMAQIQEFGRQMTAQHHRNMAAIQQSAQRHQQRMEAIQQQGDASMKGYYDRMAAGDAQHRNFLNYINDENTVVGASGKTFQVDNSYQRYFMHKRDHTYIGGDTRMDLDALRGLGLNPDDYEEVKIQK
ncbi:hypothetical protein [Pyxidicoccus sp. MSG2]|uniref:hypothetical protein n=1 Tax=Pyxidicoccus sp. MSG2 TaxID=2996790 RepID=UPI002270BCB8|nr:hypothetical protein [Pyxidicoccus sp. MSG2]MCY1023643.1 hypothetical protein [Pyxidicoccus sp. MSG2]